MTFPQLQLRQYTLSLPRGGAGVRQV